MSSRRTVLRAERRSSFVPRHRSSPSASTVDRRWSVTTWICQQVGKMPISKPTARRSSSARRRLYGRALRRRRADSIPLRAGLWNEWYLVFDDMRGGWLGEARGNYASRFSPGLRIDSFVRLDQSRRNIVLDAAHSSWSTSERRASRRRRVPFESAQATSAGRRYRTTTSHIDTATTPRWCSSISTASRRSRAHDGRP